MRTLILTVVTSFMLIGLAGCSDHGHDDDSHSHDSVPIQHHENIESTDSAETIKS